MKAKFLALAALVLGMVACHTDVIDGVKVDANGEAAVTIQVALPEATRAAGSDSAVGAIGNIDLVNDYDVRYILQVFDEKGVAAKDMEVKRSDDNTPVSFELRLVPGRHYKFVAWADFIPQNQEGEGDYLYNTAEFPVVALRNINEHNLNNEVRDAYTGVFNTEDNGGSVFNGASAINVVLTRPFAKLRVVTTDMNQLYSKLKSATVEYETPVYTSFNALNQKAGDAKSINSKTVVYGADTIYEDELNNGKMTLFADYLFGTEQDVISFTLDVADMTEFAIPTVHFNTSIPVQRNHLTTVMGPVLTDANNVTVEIKDAFAEPNIDVDMVAVETAAELAAVLTSDRESIYVVLANDIDLPISSLGQQTPGSGEYKLGGENTKSITIDLEGKKLNITTTYWSGLGAKNADALFTIKNGTMTSSQASGTWNSYDLCFANCNYVFENVDFEKAIALESAGKTFSLKNVTISETHDYYAMWISAKGQTVNIDGLTIESLGRGIKIDEQYVSAPAKVTLNIANATFKTQKKAAIVVKSVEGAEINASNLNIAEVAADKLFAVWVDEDSAAYADKVVVNGAYVKVEGADTEAASTQELQEAIAAGVDTIALADGAYTMPAISGKDVTIFGSRDVVITVSKPNMSGSDITLDGVTVKGSGYATGIQHVNTVTYNNVKVVGDMCLYGEKVEFNNCEFELNNQYVWTYGCKNTIFNACTFNTNGKAILVYNEGAGANNVTVKNCTFIASAGAKAGAIANQNCAAIEIDNFQNSSVGAAHIVTTSGNTYGENFSGEWRIKNYVAGGAITVNGVEYTQIAIDGKLMTIDAGKNVTVLE